MHNGTGSFSYRGDALREVVLPRNHPQGKKILDQVRPPTPDAYVVLFSQPLHSLACVPARKQLQPTVRLPLPHAALVAPAEDTHVTPHVIHATVDSMERFVRRLTSLPEYATTLAHHVCSLH